MKKSIYIALMLLFCAATKVLAHNMQDTIRDNPFDVAYKIIKQDADYLGAIKKLEQIKDNYTSGSDKWMYMQAKLTYNSFFGNNKEYDRFLSEFMSTPDSTDLNISKYDEEVIKYILDKTKDKQIVIINETHWTPKHRYLANIVLKKLRNQGFKYFAIEALSNQKEGIEDADLAKRKYPIQNSGFYICEPQFANMLRKALNEGYIPIAYESSGEDREYVQAMNIYAQTLEKDSKAKVLIWVGANHLEKNPKGEGAKKWMAHHLWETSSIEPFTIRQNFGDSEAWQLGNHYLAINDKRSDGKDCDIFLYNNYKEQDFKIDADKQEKAVSITLGEETKKALKKYDNLALMVYYQNEFKAMNLQAIPVINRLITNSDQNISIRLPSGNYYLAIRTPAKDLVYEEVIHVE